MVRPRRSVRSGFAAALNRLFLLAGPSLINVATRDQTASQPARPVSARAVPAGYPNGKSKPAEQPMPRRCRGSQQCLDALHRLLASSGGSRTPPFCPYLGQASQMLFSPCLGLPLADQSTATYPSKSFMLPQQVREQEPHVFLGPQPDGPFALAIAVFKAVEVPASAHPCRRAPHENESRT